MVRSVDTASFSRSQNSWNASSASSSAVLQPRPVPATRGLRRMRRHLPCRRLPWRSEPAGRRIGRAGIPDGCPTGELTASAVANTGASPSAPVAGTRMNFSTTASMRHGPRCLGLRLRALTWIKASEAARTALATPPPRWFCSWRPGGAQLLVRPDRRAAPARRSAEEAWARLATCPAAVECGRELDRPPARNAHRQSRRGTGAVAGRRRQARPWRQDAGEIERIGPRQRNPLLGGPAPHLAQFAEASGNAYCSPENPATKRPPRISPRASDRR